VTLVDRVRTTPRADLVLSGIGLLLAALYWLVAVQDPAWTALVEALLNTGLAALLAVRRTAVVPAFLATYLLLAAMAALALLSPVALSATPLLLCAPLALFAVTDRAPSRWWGVLALLAGTAGSTLSPVVQSAEPKLWLYSVHVLVLVVAFLWASRRRAVRTEQAREVEARVALARSEERARISAELHDVLGHSLTVIHAQANAALGARRSPEDTEALSAIRSVAKTSLGDIRSLVSLLRDEDVEASLDVATSLQQTLSQVEAAGLRVHADLPAPEVLDEWQQHLPPATLRALIRCVQEGLTNALRHAGAGQAATVRVAQSGACLTVAVTNSTEHPVPAPAQGHGLVGLHERVALLGGTSTSGPTAAGFELHASLPATTTTSGASR